MNRQLNLLLYTAIAKFVDDNACSEHWPKDVLFGPRLVDYMTDAASAAFDSAEDSSRYTESERSND